MLLYIRTLSGQTIKVDIYPSETIKYLKEKIGEEKKEWDPDCLLLIFAGKLLENDKIISDYNISKNSSIHVIQSFDKIVYINIFHPIKRVLPLFRGSFSPNLQILVFENTLQDILAKISLKKYEIEGTSLIYEGKRLEYNKKLSYYQKSNENPSLDIFSLIKINIKKIKRRK
ncbi:hypothetical protein M0811_01366 [Anaeramoeba ignava]|uniref:Ubiquitin-like domain-containing protein n=1 Tax=Anaeramoeba ignava TaxID=1746090 RepID=A0A9Q0LGD5_ANAIG|nr:hypothetical protein M0811_01366 [Anaeramoeba ignava]